MIYSDFKGLQLSRLGMGAMRLPTLDGGAIDEPKAMTLVTHAYENGVNYYDTGYFYLGGESERFIGKALSQFPRESWHLAAKMPGNLMRPMGDGKWEVAGFGLQNRIISGPAEVFEGQLAKCGVDYFDFYMLHNVSENTYATYTDEKLGLLAYLLEQKANGRIRHLGFSSHGRAETIEQFLRWHSDFDFAMIQVNYLDWVLQEAAKKHEVLTRHGIPVFAMEPCRGGKMAHMRDEADALMKALRPQASHASWAFRFLQSLENLPVIVSGMTTMAQLQENLALFAQHDPISETERAMLRQVVETVTELVPCTTCRYCVDVCPQKLDIPLLLSMYNEAGYDIMWCLGAAIRGLAEHERPNACVNCGACNPLCPQNIDISVALKRFSELIK